MDTEIIGIMFGHNDGTVGYWSGFTVWQDNSSQFGKFFQNMIRKGTL